LMYGIFGKIIIFVCDDNALCPAQELNEIGISKYDEQYFVLWRYSLHKCSLCRTEAIITSATGIARQVMNADYDHVGGGTTFLKIFGSDLFRRSDCAQSGKCFF